MASASRATARMSSADGLFAMRYSGSSRASFCLAGSSEGNGLSVMAMMVRGMKNSSGSSWPGRARRRRLEGEHLRIDPVQQFPAFQARKHIDTDDLGHLLEHFRCGAAEMWCEHDIRHRLEALVDFRLVLEHIKPGAGDLFLLQRTHERRLVDNGAARGVDQKRSLFH